MVDITEQDVEQYKDYVRTYIKAFHAIMDDKVNKGQAGPILRANWNQFKTEFYLRLRNDWLQKRLPLSIKGVNIADMNLLLAHLEPWMEKEFRRSISVVPEAEEIVAPTTTLGRYREYLWNKEYDKAREEFAKMSPKEQEEAHEIAKRVFAASLYGLHNTLARQGFTNEAKLVTGLLDKIDKQIRDELKKDG